MCWWFKPVCVFERALLCWLLSFAVCVQRAAAQRAHCQHEQQLLKDLTGGHMHMHLMGACSMHLLAIAQGSICVGLVGMGCT